MGSVVLTVSYISPPIIFGFALTLEVHLHWKVLKLEHPRKEIYGGRCCRLRTTFPLSQLGHLSPHFKPPICASELEVVELFVTVVAWEVVESDTSIGSLLEFNTSRYSLAVVKSPDIVKSLTQQLATQNRYLTLKVAGLKFKTGSLGGNNYPRPCACI